MGERRWRMGVTRCLLRKCPRLFCYDEKIMGVTYHRAQCNQQMPDEAVWFADVRSVTRERCKELREELQKKRNV